MPDWPANLNIDNWILRDHLDTLGDRVAIRTDSGNTTYSELDAMASAYALELSLNGLSRFDRVLILLPDGPSFAAGLFAIFRAGGVAVMVNPHLASDAMLGILKTARARVALVDLAYRYDIDRAVAAAGLELAVIDPSTVAISGSFATVESAPGDPAIWLFSGGTTGAPKAVPQSHRSLANTTRLYGQGTLGMTSDDITISVPKLYFGYATGTNLLFPLSVGASTVLFDEHPTPEVLFEKIERYRPTVMVNVPSAINQMLNDPRAADADLSSLRLATSAGEALPEALYHGWKDRFGVELLDGLGTAEMWHIFISNTVADTKPGTLGRVVPGFEIKACDDDGHEVPAGEVGRLWVRGDSLGLGYFDDQTRTAEAFRDDWFLGGDLVSIDRDGFVTHRGRADDAIKVKGKWFRPQEVESVLLGHEDVREVAVVAVADSDGLAKPVAFVVAQREVAEQTLIDWVLSQLEPYKHPRRVYFVDQLPQTHLGKIDRSALKRLAV
ncbi:MAG TPA: benzoate-CoA ligase family protein [Acidimicrobiia bacterium]